MRISDWSSDVCSSDLNDHPELMPILTAAFEERLAVGDIEIGGIKFARQDFARHAVALDIGEMRLGAAEPLPGKRADRKSVGEGKRVSGRVDLGGRRILQKKKRM